MKKCYFATHQSIYIHPVIFDDIDAEMVKKTAIKTKGAAGPSNFDADREEERASVRSVCFCMLVGELPDRL